MRLHLPTYFTRTGEDKLAPSGAARDPRDMMKWIQGLEYEGNFLEGALQNVAFAKSYAQVAHGKDFFGLTTVDRDEKRALWGAGNSLRYDILDGLFAKASYEYAIRLPEPVEMFGSGQFVAENVNLKPERSHNVNVTLALERLMTRAGLLRGSVTGFLRHADELIVRLIRNEIYRYENVLSARVRGVEGALKWLLPGDHVELGLNATFQDMRNESTGGDFGSYRGDRIPNLPYFWTNGSLRLQKRDLAALGDELSLTWYTRYVHDYFLTWESIGRTDTHLSTPPQLLHSAVLSYVVARDRHEVAFTTEMRNITDQKIYDFYGVQLPGRAAYFKASLTY